MTRRRAGKPMALATLAFKLARGYARRPRADRTDTEAGVPARHRSSERRHGDREHREAGGTYPPARDD